MQTGRMLVAVMLAAGLAVATAPVVAQQGTHAAVIQPAVAQPAVAQPGVPADLMGFWQAGAMGLAQTPLQFTYSAATGTVEFRGHKGRRAWATLALPATPAPYAGAMVHIGDSGAAPTVFPPGDGLVHMYLGWAPAAPGAPWSDQGLAGRRDYALYGAILDCYQAVSVLLSMPALQAGTVVLVGEGVGATVALALAALRPNDVSFVIAYQPWLARHPIGSPRQAAAAAYFDATSFATQVQAPALVVVSDRHPRLSLSEAQRLTDALAGPRKLQVVRGLGHGPLSAWHSGPGVCRQEALSWLGSPQVSFAPEEVPVEEAFIARQVR